MIFLFFIVTLVAEWSGSKYQKAASWEIQLVNIVNFLTIEAF